MKNIFISFLYILIKSTFYMIWKLNLSYELCKSFELCKLYEYFMNILKSFEIALSVLNIIFLFSTNFQNIFVKI